MAQTMKEQEVSAEPQTAFTHADAEALVLANESGYQGRFMRIYVSVKAELRLKLPPSVRRKSADLLTSVAVGSMDADNLNEPCCLLPPWYVQCPVWHGRWGQCGS